MLGKAEFLAMVVVWYAIRLPHMLRARRTTIVASKRDFRERMLMMVSGAGLGLIPIGYIAFGFSGLGDRPASPALTTAGFVVEAFALVLFWASHRDLGRQWSVSLELRRDHVLRVDGLYSHVRHPMYAAFWLWALAQAMLLPNWIAGLSGFAGFGCLYVFRVPMEERMMYEQFGVSYCDYASQTPRLIPRRRPKS